MSMLLLPVEIRTTVPDSSFQQDICAFEVRLARARRWRRRRRLLMLRRLLRGRMPGRLPVPAGGPPHRCDPAAQ